MEDSAYDYLEYSVHICKNVDFSCSPFFKELKLELAELKCVLVTTRGELEVTSREVSIFGG